MQSHEQAAHPEGGRLQGGRENVLGMCVCVCVGGGTLTWRESVVGVGVGWWRSPGRGLALEQVGPCQRPVLTPPFVFL